MSGLIEDSLRPASVLHLLQDHTSCSFWNIPLSTHELTREIEWKGSGCFRVIVKTMFPPRPRAGPARHGNCWSKRRERAARKHLHRSCAVSFIAFKLRSFLPSRIHKQLLLELIWHAAWGEALSWLFPKDLTVLSAYIAFFSLPIWCVWFPSLHLKILLLITGPALISIRLFFPVCPF